MANEVLIGKISIPESNVHRIPAERTPREASLAYEDELRRHFGIKRDQFPRFDIILLGLGEDGHTASLFPRSPALWEKERLVIDTYVDTIGSHRITLTLPVINNAAQLLFLVSGKGKADIVQQVFEDHKVRYPAQMVKPVSGSLCWLVDTDAASQLEIVHHR
jgi:6-phosphogluconolactonase